MLNIQRFVCNDIQENCYIVSDETKKAAIIDCGAQYEAERKAIRQYIEQQELQPEHLLVTHGHIDHNIGNAWVYKTYGLKPEVHSDDQKLMECLDIQAQAIMSTSLDEPMPPVGRYLTKDDTITIGNHIFSLLETPGHTPVVSSTIASRSIWPFPETPSSKAASDAPTLKAAPCSCSSKASV